MARPKDKSKEEAIFHSALQIVHEGGIGDLTMGHIAEGAGLAVGTLYVYFRNKNSLIQALYVHVHEKRANDVQKNYAPDAPFMIRFERIWRNYANFLATKPAEAAFIRQYARSSFAQAYAIRKGEESLKLLVEVLEKGKEVRLISDIPTPLLVAQITGSISEIVLAEKADKFTFTPQNMRHTVAMAWNSIKR